MMLDSFKNRMERMGKSQSSSYLHNAEKAIDATFKRDPAYREVVVIHAPSGIDHCKYDAKFMIETRRAITGDEESYRLMLRPHVHIPIGSYVDIPNADGIKERWLVVLEDSQPQFPVYYILKCNWVLKWKVNDVIYKVDAVQRTQSSYNSGEWSRDYFTVVQDQTIMLLPTTQYTQTISYNQRVLISDSGRAVPIAWHVSKVLDTIPLGITRLTFVQEQTDVPDDCGKFGIANWCNNTDRSGTKTEICKYCLLEEPEYIDAGTTIVEEEFPTGKISYNGKNATLRVGGSMKVFNAEFWDDYSMTYVSDQPKWKFSFMDGETLLCSVNLDFSASIGWTVNAASDNPEGVIVRTDPATPSPENTSCSIICSTSLNDIFKVKVTAFGTDLRSLKLCCLNLYSMVGKKIVISAENNVGKYTTETTMEVIS